MNLKEATEHRLHQAFEVGILLKGANALLELLLGALLLFVDVRDIVAAFVQNELVEDPDDFLATHLAPLTAKLPPNAELYSALYLLSHGIIKAFLVWGLLRQKAWAFPASLAVLTLFVLYQLIKFAQNHSIALMLLTIFDLIIMWLIYHEWRTKYPTRA